MGGLIIMTEFKHSPERDEEVLKEIADILECWPVGDNEELLLKLIPLTKELMSITRKWRSKALMRASKIEELTSTTLAE